MAPINNSDSQPPSSTGERRRHVRHLACFPAYLERAGVTRSAIIRDMSVHGAMLLTRAQLQPGERLTLQLYIVDNMREPVLATARVVRTDVWGDGTGLWRYTVGVEFDAPVSAYERQIKELAARQAQQGLPR